MSSSITQILEVISERQSRIFLSYLQVCCQTAEPLFLTREWCVLNHKTSPNSKITGRAKPSRGWPRRLSLNHMTALCAVHFAAVEVGGIRHVAGTLNAPAVMVTCGFFYLCAFFASELSRQSFDRHFPTAWWRWPCFSLLKILGLACFVNLIATCVVVWWKITLILTLILVVPFVLTLILVKSLFLVKLLTILFYHILRWDVSKAAKPPETPFASLYETESAGMLQLGDGILLGTQRFQKEDVFPDYDDAAHAAPPYLVDGSDTHLMAFAPTGAGKTTALIIPTVLNNPHSFKVVMDVKGEIFDITSARLRRCEAVVKFDPLQVGSDFQAYNVLDEIKNSANLESDLLSLATLLIPNPADSKQSHWIQMAQSLFVGVAGGLIIGFPRKANLAEVADIISDPQKLGDFMDWIKKSGHPLLKSLATKLSGDRSAANPRLEDIQSATFIMREHLAPFVDSIVRQSISHSDFIFDNLIRNPGACFIVASPASLTSHNVLFKTVCWGVNYAATKKERLTKSQTDQAPLLLILDEAGVIGRMKLVEDALVIGRGYGIRILAIFQNLQQVAANYPSHQTLLANSSLLFWAINDSETAEVVAQYLGNHPFEEVASSSVVHDPNVYHSILEAIVNRLFPNRTKTEVVTYKYRLWTASELKHLPPDLFFYFARSVQRPILGRIIPYFRSSLFGGLSRDPH